MALRILVVLLIVSAAAGPGRGQDADAQPLELAGLLSLSLEHDGRIRAAYANLDAYRARYQQARWAWFPAIKLQALLGGPVGERKLACPDDPDCVRLTSSEGSGLGDLSSQVSFAVGGKLEAVVPLYTFGKLDGLRDAARAGVAASRADIDRARQEVALQVRQAWYGWLLACSAVEVLADGDQKIRDAETKLVKMLEELNEEVTERDLFKLRYYAAEVRTLLVQARQGKQTALAALRFLTGIEQLGHSLPLAESELSAPKAPPILRDLALEQASKSRPELIALDAALRAARALVDMQRASFYPDIFIAGSLEGSYSPAHDYIGNSLLNRGLTYYTGGLSLGLQISLDIPQKMARLEQAEAEARRLEIQVEQARQAIGLEIDRQLGSLDAARQRVQLYRKGHRAAKAWMRSNVMSYGVGLANTKDLLDSVAAFAKSKLDRDQAIHDLLLAQDQLRMAAGQDLSANPTDPPPDAPAADRQPSP
jgi:outer membrane protein TolC